MIKPTTKKELLQIIDEHIEKEGTTCNLNDIDVSEITDMSYLFSYSAFNGDISMWDVSHVTNMSFMFDDSNFTGDLSKWNVSNVISMERMFSFSDFNGNISNWDVSSVKHHRHIFINCSLSWNKYKQPKFIKDS